MSKRALGKGLDALISTEKPTEQAGGSGSLKTVAVDRIDPAPDQPRKHFDTERLEELAESIKRQGIIQPIVVEAVGDRFSIVAGERRYRAAKLAGLAEVPIVIAKYGSEKRLLVSLIENLQREDLDPIEEAEAYRKLIEQTNLNQDALAEQIGKNRATVANSLRLLNLPDDMKNSVRSGDISAGHARALLSIVDETERTRVFARIVKEGLSVREAEELARRQPGSRNEVQKARKSRTTNTSPDVQRVEQRFIEALGTKVRVKGSLTRGTLEISYFSKEDLERLYGLIVEE